MLLSWRAWLFADILGLMEPVRVLSAFVSPNLLNTAVSEYHWTQCRRARCRGTAQMMAKLLSSGQVARGSSSEKQRGGVQELRKLTWMEVEARIKRDIAETGSCAVVVPVGATEQHGPNGLIGTDHMTAEVCMRKLAGLSSIRAYERVPFEILPAVAVAVARGLSEATSTLIAPSVNYGMSVHHSDFSGTVTLSPATFVGVVRDVASSLERSGFTHVLFVNGHGGNVGPTYKAFADVAGEQEQGRQDKEGGTTSPSQSEKPVELPSDHHLQAGQSEAMSVGDHAAGGQQQQQQQQQRFDVAAGGVSAGCAGSDGGGVEVEVEVDVASRQRARLKLFNWYAGRELSALAKELYGKEKGMHATPDEVAVTQHLFPAAVKAGVPLDPSAIQVAKDMGGMTKRVRDEETGLPVMDPQDFRRRFPDGRMFSNPGLATPEHGRRLLDASVQDAVEILSKFISGEDLVEEAAARAAAKKKTSLKQKSRWAESRGTGKGRWAPRRSRRRGDAEPKAAM